MYMFLMSDVACAAHTQRWLRKGYGQASPAREWSRALQQQMRPTQPYGGITAACICYGV